ncbi:hypothetical protein FB567DRAFT_577632 [Paraphoma chrysanthemicola]|uniref:Uncharacterized protein n=1 Tax=Paraphoma chrysanthemicola TaxID=798071 RepID=A0A8K0W0R6_9PLEO|nr:hypothetical protein FB567DRAFT_577632 [Paraphoma chrysanthemicola]
MAKLPPKPRYYLSPTTLPCPHLVRLKDLSEGGSRLASVTYPSKAADSIGEEASRRNFTKLIMARYSHVDPTFYELISRKGSIKNQELATKKTQKWAKDIQNNWVGTNSWVQKYVISAITWADLQVLLNNLNRQVTVLGFPPGGESVAEKDARQERRQEYKKALRLHQDHIRQGVDDIIKKANDVLELASMIEKSMARIVELRKEKDFVERYEGGLKPREIKAVARLQDVAPADLYFAQKSKIERVAFLEGLWDQDTFVSFLWCFQGVLHFKKNWETISIRDMFKEKFVIVANAIVDNVLMPRNITASCIESSLCSLRTAEMKPNMIATYDKLKSADEELGKNKKSIGGYGILWVQGDRHMRSRTKKRPLGCDSDEGGGGVFQALRRARQKY